MAGALFPDAQCCVFFFLAAISAVFRLYFSAGSFVSVKGMSHTYFLLPTATGTQCCSLFALGSTSGSWALSAPLAPPELLCRISRPVYRYWDSCHTVPDHYLDISTLNLIMIILTPTPSLSSQRLRGTLFICICCSFDELNLRLSP